jgi:hypothetical protein
MSFPEAPNSAAPENAAPQPRVTSHWWPYILGAWTFLLLLWLVPVFQTANLKMEPAARLTLETQIRDVWAKSLWAGITVVGAALVWRYLARLSMVVENSAKTLAAAERNAYFASQSATSDRYGRAMALLSDERMEVRLGGIYALERLALESQKDHGPIIEVLAAFVREQSAWSDEVPTPARPRADVQAILTVLSRRAHEQDPPDHHVDLHGVNIARAYLPWANLEQAFLYEANLEGALLQNANLRGAWLWKANLADVSLEGAHLEGADLTGAAGITEAQLRGAHFDRTTKLPGHLMDTESRAANGAHEELDPQDLQLPSKR